MCGGGGDLFESVKTSLNPFRKGLSGKERLSMLADPADYLGYRKKEEAESQVRRAERAEAAAKEQAGKAEAAEMLRRKRAARASTLLAGGFDPATGSMTGYNPSSTMGG